MDKMLSLPDEQPDLFSAADFLRDKALQRVKESSDPWLKYALEMLKRVPNGTVGTSEDFRNALYVMGCETPIHHNAWGMFTKNAIRLKLFEPTGEWRKMRDPKSHARMTPVYRLHHG